jgi:hypothetical protein
VSQHEVSRVFPVLFDHLLFQVRTYPLEDVVYADKVSLDLGVEVWSSTLNPVLDGLDVLIAHGRHFVHLHRGRHGLGVDTHEEIGAVGIVGHQLSGLEHLLHIEDVVEASFGLSVFAMAVVAALLEDALSVLFKRFVPTPRCVRLASVTHYVGGVFLREPQAPASFTTA